MRFVVGSGIPLILRSVLSLSLEKSKKRHTDYLDNLEAATGDITLGFTTLTETGDQHLIVLIDEVEATITRNETGDLLAVLDELHTHTLTNSGVGLLSLKTTKLKGERKVTTRQQ